jgi:predicted nucleic acid-binding protein
LQPLMPFSTESSEHLEMTRSQSTPATRLVYDTGALIAAEDNDRRMWALHARALQRGIQPVVPAGCLVEAWHGGRQTNISRLLDGCKVDVLDLAMAKQAGVLRKGLDKTVSAVDATVAEAAIRLRAAIVTSDRGDIELLTKPRRRKTAIIDV